MGTRNLVAVILDGEPRIAQYGQWDGYLSAQGFRVACFIHDNLLSIEGLEKFKAAVRECRFITEEEYKAAWGPKESKNMAEYEQWKTQFAGLSRDTGANILNMVLNDGVRQLLNSWNFGGESLHCEFAYVIDLDNQILEIYRGFQHERPPDGERFSHYDPKDHQKKYYGCKLVGKLPFSSIRREDFVMENEENIFNEC